jgi:hypothetical protein
MVVFDVTPNIPPMLCLQRSIKNVKIKNIFQLRVKSMPRLLRPLLLSLFTTTVLITFAAPNNTGTDAQTLSDEQNKAVLAYSDPFQAACPQTEELIKNANSIWLTRSKWQSFNPSFVKKLTVFLGAQWQGEHVGHLLCEYTDDSGLTFPVTMQAPFLSKTPTGPNWQRSQTKARTYECKSNTIDDCKIIGLKKRVSNLSKEKQVQDFLHSIRPK